MLYMHFRKILCPPVIFNVTNLTCSNNKHLYFFYLNAGYKSIISYILIYEKCFNIYPHWQLYQFYKTEFNNFAIYRFQTLLHNKRKDLYSNLFENLFTLQQKVLFH